MLRHAHGVLRGEAESAAVEQHVVEAAQAERVRHHVRALGREPPDVRSVESDRHGVDAAVVPADRTPVLVGEQHSFSKARITAAVLGSEPTAREIDLDLFEVESDRGRDPFVK